MFYVNVMCKDTFYLLYTYSKDKLVGMCIRWL